MKSSKVLVAFLAATLAVGASVAVAQTVAPVADAGFDRTVAAYNYAGEFVQLRGGRSTGEDLEYFWKVTATPATPETPFGWYEYDSSGTLVPTETGTGRTAVGFFPIGATTVELTVKDKYGATSDPDTVVITVTDRRQLSYVLYHRPWASDLQRLTDRILSDCQALKALEPTNPNFGWALNAATTANDCDDQCNSLRFYYALLLDGTLDYTPYVEVVNAQYLQLRQFQVGRHEDVALHVSHGKGKSWSVREKRVFNESLDAAGIAEYDFEQGTAPATSSP